jgi:hypothetical protein
MAVATKKIIIAIAAVTLAIAAMWYAFKIFSFNSLSESEAKWWLFASELILLISAFLLTLGLIGEWPDSEDWKKRFLYQAAKSAVVIGVLGELLGDAGIFETSRRLQALQDRATVKLLVAANEAKERTAKAELELAKIKLELGRVDKFDPVTS